MDRVDMPYFCLTGDLDWVSDYAISDFVRIASEYGIKPTIFATHKSRKLTEFMEHGDIEIGIHPNFLPGSSHGNDVSSVINFMCATFPMARVFRSHKFFHNFLIEQEMVRRKVCYDSNLCLYFQPDIVPLRRCSGLVSFPVFWEDDIHLFNDGEWNLDKYLSYFLSPGLKILNFHPFFVTANIPDIEYYLKVRKHITTLSADTVENIRYEREGSRTFFINLLKTLTLQGRRFYTLNELFRRYRMSDKEKQEDENSIFRSK